MITQFPVLIAHPDFLRWGEHAENTNFPLQYPVLERNGALRGGLGRALNKQGSHRRSIVKCNPSFSTSLSRKSCLGVSCEVFLSSRKMMV